MPLAKAAKRGGTLMRRADDRAAPVRAAAERLQVLADDVSRFRGVAREREPDAVEDRALAEVHDVGGNARARGCGR